MNLETFDAIFMTLAPAFLVLVAILFPLSIIGKVVLVIVFMKGMKNGQPSPLAALALGPAALVLSRQPEGKKAEKPAAFQAEPALPEVPPPLEEF